MPKALARNVTGRNTVAMRDRLVETFSARMAEMCPITTSKHQNSRVSSALNRNHEPEETISLIVIPTVFKSIDILNLSLETSRSKLIAVYQQRDIRQVIL